ncbi:hypothetical protein [Cognatitamlana onchidii]|uniref:hypothetical protein n=1 Tax=Cognatitamlana onchidii TaxID=2562860 RepID=UPI0010A6AE5A|nr:hypothetical protein [Algibacter onchidii]
MINKLQLISILLIFLSFFNCAPKLTYIEIKEKVNNKYIALNEKDFEYEYNNLPEKYIMEYGEEGLIKKLQETYELRKKDKFPITYDDIGDFKIQPINKCNSTYFYKVKYIVDKVQMTPYLDSLALERNYKNYGKENVSFNSILKILEVRLYKEDILIFDKDKVWKLLAFKDFDSQLYDRLFRKGFSECVKTKIDNAEYLPYW